MRQSRGEAAYLLVACSAWPGVAPWAGITGPNPGNRVCGGWHHCRPAAFVFNLGRPRRLILALIAIPFLVILGYGLMRGIFWYFMTYLPSTGEPLIKLGP